MSGFARHIGRGAASAAQRLLSSRRMLTIARNVAVVLLVLSATGNGWAIRETVETQRTQDQVQNDLATAQRDLGQLLRQVQAGRQLGLQTTCAAINVVIGAGQRVINPPGRERDGSELARELAAASYARDVATHMATEIERLTGLEDLNGLVNTRKGTLDCRQLARIAKAQVP